MVLILEVKGSTFGPGFLQEVESAIPGSQAISEGEWINLECPATTIPAIPREKAAQLPGVVSVMWKE